MQFSVKKKNREEQACSPHLDGHRDVTAIERMEIKLQRDIPCTSDITR
jgi:hypothetical protein